MILIDSHSHLYLDNFDDDRNDVMQRALKNRVKKIMLPNIDSTSINKMLELSRQYPENCYPMMGLHPTSVNEKYQIELDIVKSWLKKEKFYGIGETGIDLYWDKTFIQEQIHSFENHIDLSIEYDLPIVIHCRESFDEIFRILENKPDSRIKGVFHSFSGNLYQAEKAIEMGFKLGIGGILSFKNSGLDKVVEKIDLSNIILETDSPFLAPVPKRGRRNESSYLVYIGMKLAEIYRMDFESIVRITTNNSCKLFNI